MRDLLRVAVKASGAKVKKVEEDKKRKRDDPAEMDQAVARSQERQKMKDKLDELGTHLALPHTIATESCYPGTNLWNRTLVINRVTKMAREAARQIDDDHSRKQTRQDVLAQWDKLFAYSE